MKYQLKHIGFDNIVTICICDNNEELRQTRRLFKVKSLMWLIPALIFAPLGFLSIIIWFDMMLSHKFVLIKEETK